MMFMDLKIQYNKYVNSFKLIHKFNILLIKIPADVFVYLPSDCKMYMRKQKNCNSYNNLKRKE